MAERVQAGMAAVSEAIVQWRAKAEGTRWRVAPTASGGDRSVTARKLMESRRSQPAMREVEAILKMAR